MTGTLRVRARAVLETAGTVLLVATLVLKAIDESLRYELSLPSEFALSLGAAVLFLGAAALSTAAPRAWLSITGGFSLVIAVAQLVHMAQEPLLNGLHIVPLTLIVCSAMAGHSSTLRRRSLERGRAQARRDGEERERRRWARELHDDTLQELGAVQVVLASAVASGRPDAMREAIDQARSLVGNQITSLRHLIVELRPFALDQLGLAPALEALRRRNSETFGVDVELRVGARWGRLGDGLPPEAQAHVYRIVQEAVANAVKHADPTRILVELDSDDHAVTTRVTDNGRGMTLPPDTETGRSSSRAGASPPTRAGMGLQDMRERAHLLDAHLQVRSAPNEGTCVTLRIPHHGKDSRGCCRYMKTPNRRRRSRNRWRAAGA